MSDCIVYDMTFKLSLETHKTGWFPFQPAEFIKSREFRAEFDQHMHHLELGAAAGNKIAIAALEGHEVMFPEGD